ncbi:ABC transporter [Desulfosarcina alkanivorans]|jgi:iron complex transport system ATP-binding protein|uniref:ABC transporter n=1 Tax=Desulfosarcina alkanivorans TaxID=571177 RepID=A0A5K7YPK4_9BACT|nr:ABC transporter ATP-binding protein [Desulfosarcina alkanivorans]BBO71156.1 ABC transporter [Desulfosarcina alkanivorans]
MSLVCRNLHFAYNGHAILSAVDLDVRKGEFCVLLGRNGSGKTTLIYCLAGLLQPRQGSIAIDGLDLAAAPRTEIARRVSLVPQEHSDIFPFRVLDVVVMGRTAQLGFAQRPGPDDYLAARRVLAELEAEPLAERNFNRISGGERRIALLARAILQADGTLLLDEPTNHLDFNNKYRLLAKIKNRCRAKGTRVVASLHDPNLAARFADTVVMLTGGRVMASGDVHAVMTAEMISRLYQTPARRVEAEGGDVIFIPKITDGAGNLMENTRWT